MCLLALLHIDKRGKMGMTRDKLAEKLQDYGTETRNLFHPLHEVPPYQKYANLPYPVSSAISRRRLSLPLSVKLTEENIVFITRKIKEAIS